MRGGYARGMGCGDAVSEVSGDGSGEFEGQWGDDGNGGLSISVKSPCADRAIAFQGERVITATADGDDIG